MEVPGVSTAGRILSSETSVDHLRSTRRPFPIVIVVPFLLPLSSYASCLTVETVLCTHCTNGKTVTLIHNTNKDGKSGRWSTTSIDSNQMNTILKNILTFIPFIQIDYKFTECRKVFFMPVSWLLFLVRFVFSDTLFQDP